MGNLKKNVRAQTIREEILNAIIHGIGIILSIIGLVLLIIKSNNNHNIWQIVSSAIFGTSMIILYSTSTLYHSITNVKTKEILNIFDHCVIYILMIGSYTPFMLVTLRGTFGITILIVIWVLSFAGIITKIFFYSKLYKISSYIYLLLGWLIVIAIKPLYENLSSTGTLWLVLGGLSYSIGVLFYLWRKQKFSHAIFHFFVLAGSIFHFFSVYWYVLK